MEWAEKQEVDVVCSFPRIVNLVASHANVYFSQRRSSNWTPLIFIPYKSDPMMAAPSPNFITLLGIQQYGRGQSLKENDRPDFCVTIDAVEPTLEGRGCDTSSVRKTLQDNSTDSKNNGSIALAVGLAALVLVFVRFAYEGEASPEDKVIAFKRAPIMRAVFQEMCEEDRNVLEPNRLWRKLLVNAGDIDAAGNVFDAFLSRDERKRKMKKIFDGIIATATKKNE
jgi:hypothetical protein